MRMQVQVDSKPFSGGESMSNVLDILQGTTFGYKDMIMLDSMYPSSIAEMFLLRLYSHFNFG